MMSSPIAVLLSAVLAFAPATTSYTHNTLNQYTAVGGVTLTYDPNGNLTYLLTR